LKREGLITDNPLDNVKRPKTEQKIVQALTPKEVQKLISLCLAKTTLDTRNKAIIMMFLDIKRISLFLHNNLAIFNLDFFIYLWNGIIPMFVEAFNYRFS
jgi:site-specific recombinase XerC